MRIFYNVSKIFLIFMIRNMIKNIINADKYYVKKLCSKKDKKYFNKLSFVPKYLFLLLAITNENKINKKDILDIVLSYINEFDKIKEAVKKYDILLNWIRNKEDFYSFMKFFGIELYLENMIKEDRYNVEDIADLNINRMIDTEELVIDCRDTLSRIYDVYTPESIKIDNIENNINKYYYNLVGMFQIVYKKYVNSNHKIDPSAYSDIVVV
jgi:hypothetical protein